MYPVKEHFQSEEKNIMSKDTVMQWVRSGSTTSLSDMPNAQQLADHGISRQYRNPANIEEKNSCSVTQKSAIY